ncbi:MAG TPA: hypothetical protein VFW78_08190 [Bacteroidia bacterium]|nr:hypothetical protein [Bacteroidia bacterium]
MILRCFFVSLCSLLYFQEVFGGLAPAGSQSLALAGATVTQSGLWSALNNPAGLSTIHSFGAGTYAESRFLIPGTLQKGCVTAFPVSSTTAALACSSFGNANFADQVFVCAMARTFGEKIQAGVRFEYHSLRFTSDYNTGSGVTASCGAIIKITGKSSLGISVVNPTRAKYNHSDVRIPSQFKSGMKWDVSAAASCLFEIEKIPGVPPFFRAGTEYKPNPKFSFRAGVSNSFIPFSLGFSFLAGALSVDVATGYHQLLGITPSVSLSWIKRK